LRVRLRPASFRPTSPAEPEVARSNRAGRIARSTCKAAVPTDVERFGATPNEAVRLTAIVCSLSRLEEPAHVAAPLSGIPCRLCSTTPGPPESDIGSALVDEVDRFHVAYYDSEVWKDDTRWLGVPRSEVSAGSLDLSGAPLPAAPRPRDRNGHGLGRERLLPCSGMDLMGRGRVLTIDIRTIEGNPVQPRTEVC
jgi:hypothetical protein